MDVCTEAINPSRCSRWGAGGEDIGIYFYTERVDIAVPQIGIEKHLAKPTTFSISAPQGLNGVLQAT